MKSLWLIPVLVLAISTAGFSQSYLNVRVGANFSQIDETYDAREINARAGIQLGASIRLGNQLYFEPGLYYFQINNEVEIFETDEVDVVLDERDTKIKGFKMPLFVGVDLLKDERTALRLYGGPNATFLVETDENVFGNEEVEYNRATWGLNAGVGIDLGRITIDLHHEWGMSDAFNDDSASSRNQVLYLTAGLLF